MNLMGMYQLTGAVVLFLSIQSTTASVSCYECYSDQRVNVDTRLQPFSEDLTSTSCISRYPSSNSSCEGMACLVIKNDLQVQGYTLESTCVSEEDFSRTGIDFTILPSNYPINRKTCSFLNFYQSQYTFYYFNEMCCFTDSVYSNETMSAYNRTFCACNTDYCNSDMRSFYPKGSTMPSSDVRNFYPKGSTMPSIRVQPTAAMAGRVRSSLWCLYVGVLVLAIGGVSSRYVEHWI